MADDQVDQHFDSNEDSFDESAEDNFGSEEDEWTRDEDGDDDDQVEGSRTEDGASAPKKGSYVFPTVIVCGILCALLPVWFNAPNGYSLLKQSFAGGGAVTNQQTKWCVPKDERLFTKEELTRYTDKPKILLGFLGVVYDVTGGSYYQPDGSYSFFAGKDGTRAFLTGEFTADELYDDITDLDQSYLSGIDTWLNLYDDKYKRVGRVVGAYFDENGCDTEKLRLVRKRIKKAKNSDEEDKQELQKYPPCNSEWNATEKRGRVWCTTLSGGINRSWAGQPRQLYVLGSKSWRCACVKDDNDVTVEDWCDKQSATKSSEAAGGQTKSGVKYAPDESGNTPNCLWKHYPDCDVQATECPFRD